MSKYTTGELAKLCGVSVRTVQYYDARDILVPSELSEGGRRLYSEEDLSKLKIICFLRELELPIDSIRNLFQEKQPEHVISVLLEEQERCLRREMEQKQARVDRIAEVRKRLRQISPVTVKSLGDVAYIMNNRKFHRRLHITMLAFGFVMDTIEVSTLMLWIFTGIWWPFALGMAVVIAIGIWISALYYRSTVFICPECHGIFRPGVWESLFARHTPHTRKLTCRHCGHHGFCVETYSKEEPKC